MTPAKRIRLDSTPTPPHDIEGPSAASKPLEEDNCSICLQQIVDRTVIPTCSHEFCFECLLVWSEQSRKCPLCSQSVGDHVIHHIRSIHDYQKHYLLPLRTSPRPVQSRSRPNTRARRAEREWGRRERQEQEEADRLDRAITRRRWIYQHHLYAKHVASNSFTRYRPYPSPSQFVASPDLLSRMTIFLRRELRVWVNLDVEFLTTFILSLMKSIDIRSQSAIKLLAEFLDMDTEYVEGQRYPNAEHFAHEVYSYLRSPYKDLFVYDTVVQYDIPSQLPAPPQHERSGRWRSPPRSRSRTNHRSRSLSRSPSLSWSPSGRHYERIAENSPHSSHRSRDMDTNRDRRPPERREVNKDQTPRTRVSVAESPISTSPHYNDSTDNKASRNNSSDTYGIPSCDGKGKKRAPDEDEIRYTPPAPTACSSLAKANSSSSLDATKDPNLCGIMNDSDSGRDALECKEIRPPRRTNLRDSVRAYLEPKRKPPTSPVDPVSNKSEPTMPENQVPSLLARLSDPNEIVPETNHIPLQGETDDPTGIAKVRMNDNPEITTHAQARLARLKDETKSIAGLGNSGQDLVPSTHVDRPQDARSLLLSRLEGERRNLQRTSPSTPHPITPGPIDASQEQAEASLRRRAQLHARLAAAKRDQ